jgi:hypothetical protein
MFESVEPYERSTIRQPRTLCSLENYDPPRREKLPLWNTETLHIHRSFISKNFTETRSPTVKQRDLEIKATTSNNNPASISECRFGMPSNLGSRTFVTRKKDFGKSGILQTSFVENSQTYLEIARWLKVKELSTMTIRLQAFDFPALSVLASHFRLGASLQAGASKPRVRFCASHD